MQKPALPMNVVVCKRLGVKGGYTWVEHDPRCNGRCLDKPRFAEYRGELKPAPPLLLDKPEG